MSFIEDLKNNISDFGDDPDDKYNTALLGSVWEEVLKLYVLIKGDDNNQMFSKAYLLEKIEKIIDDHPIVLHPILARLYVQCREQLCEKGN